MARGLFCVRDPLLVLHAEPLALVRLHENMDSEARASQESTEPVDWAVGDSGYEGSQMSQPEPEPQHWGRLYPMKASLDVIDLVSNIVTVGKVDTDVVLTRDHLPHEVFGKCSKLHFELQRRQVWRMGAQTTQVELIDRSSNGTFINGHVLRKRSSCSQPRRKILRTNDVIGLPAGSPVIYEAYVYIDSLVTTSSVIPFPVRKKYEISLRLGAGAFGEVSLVFNRAEGKPYAMKTIVKDVHAYGHVVNGYKKRLLNELDILRAVDHPNVIKLIDVLDCEKEHFLILEYMEGKDLAHRIFQKERLEENIVKLYFYQIVKGVEYLHSQGIIHRDLKPANILLLSSKQETVLKITDFGLSKVLSPMTMMKTLCGTRFYVAPEVILGEGSYRYTEQVDIWSMGVILFVCLSGSQSLEGESDGIDRKLKEAFSVPANEWKMISHEAKLLMEKMLVKAPHRRAKIVEIISSPWMQDEKMIARANSLYGEHKGSSSSKFVSAFCSMALKSDLGDDNNDMCESTYSFKSSPQKQVNNNNDHDMSVSKCDCRSSPRKRVNYNCDMSGLTHDCRSPARKRVKTN